MSEYREPADMPAHFRGESPSFRLGWVSHKRGEQCPIFHENKRRGWMEREQARGWMEREQAERSGALTPPQKND